MPARTDAGKGVEEFRRALLAWYDRHRRVLPWRALPGRAADPYHVWLSEIMLQQTTVAAVGPYFEKFTVLWPSVGAMAAAQESEIMTAWAGLGYYSRARNLYKCAKEIAENRGSVFPDDADSLKTLPGIGDYTSAAISSIAFDRPATVIDGNVERVVARFFCIEDALPGAKKTIRFYAQTLSEGRTDRPGDFAQAMMDLGATICTPKNPRCTLCPVAENCQARQKGIQDALPKRAAKASRPQKIGYAYWIKNKEGMVLLCRRPPSGLLGGMAALPSSEWLDKKNHSNPDHPNDIMENVATLEIDQTKFIRHVFTHFELQLFAVSGEWKSRELPYNYYWADPSDISDWGLPTVFGKIAGLMIQQAISLI